MESSGEGNIQTSALRGVRGSRAVLGAQDAGKAEMSVWVETQARRGVGRAGLEGGSKTGTPGACGAVAETGCRRPRSEPLSQGPWPRRQVTRP